MPKAKRRDACLLSLYRLICYPKSHSMFFFVIVHVKLRIWRDLRVIEVESMPVAF